MASSSVWNDAQGNNDALVFALEPDLDARAGMVDRLDRLMRDQGLTGRPVKFCNLHASLCVAGRAERLREPLPQLLCRAGDAVRGAAIEVEFDRLASFRLGGSQHLLVLRAAPETRSVLRFLRLAVAGAQYAQGLYLPGASRFDAHVGLCYINQPLIGEIVIDPVRWRAEEFALVRSVPGRGVHEVLGRWPLRAQ
jgi:2'-5' RNA ligase